VNNVWFRSYPTRRRAIRAEPSGTVMMTSRFDSSVWRRGRALWRIAASSRSAAWVAGLASFDGIAGACAPTATLRSDGVACGGWVSSESSPPRTYGPACCSSALSAWKNARLSVGYVRGPTRRPPGCLSLVRPTRLNHQTVAYKSQLDQGRVARAPTSRNSSCSRLPTPSATILSPRPRASR
jgi:hypothetical protein